MMDDAEKAGQFLLEKYYEWFLEMIGEFVEGHYTMALIRLICLSTPIVIILLCVFWEWVSGKFDRLRGIKRTPPRTLTDQEYKNAVNKVIITPYNLDNRGGQSIGQLPTSEESMQTDPPQ